jgi:hypothetical protein
VAASFPSPLAVRRSRRHPEACFFVWGCGAEVVRRRSGQRACRSDWSPSSSAVRHHVAVRWRLAARGWIRPVGGTRRPDLAALQQDSTAVGVCARLPDGCTWGGGGGVVGGTAAWETPRWPRLLPFLRLPLWLQWLVNTSIVLGGSWTVKTSWRVECVRAAWKAVRPRLLPLPPSPFRIRWWLMR